MSKSHISIFDKLTDSSLYTGTHKHRFDANGNGRGMSGRDRVGKGHGFIAGMPGAPCADLSQITRSNLNTSGAGEPAWANLFPAHVPSGYAHRPISRGSSSLLYQRTSIDGGANKLVGYAVPLSPTGPSTPSPRPMSAGRNALRTSYSGAATGSYSQLSPTGASGAKTTRASDMGQRKGSSIFDRLTDPTNYTGMHRNRFSSDGRGRGAEGRTTPNAYVSPMDNVRRGC